MTQTQKCTGCGREIPAFSARCIHCGAPLPDPAPGPTKGPEAPHAVDKSTITGDQTIDTVAPWKAALILVSSLLVVFFVLHTAFVSRRTKRKSRGIRTAHRLWDKAKALAKQGEADAARRTYEKAISAMRRYAVDDPTACAAMERELEALQPAPKRETKKAAQVSAKDLEKQGFVIHPPLAFRTKAPTTYFYTGRPCVDMWVEVVNIGKKPANIRRSAFEAHFGDDKVLPAADVHEAFCLQEKSIVPGEETSGVILFGALADHAPNPKHVKEVTYAEKTIWQRTAQPQQP